MRSIQPVRLVLGLALLVGGQPIAASQSVKAAQPGGIGDHTERSLQPQSQVRSKPYRGLFQTPDLTTTTRVRSAPQSEPDKPRVVCGMTLIPIDPTIDPRIYVEPRRNDSSYSIRVIPPPVCK